MFSGYDFVEITKQNLDLLTTEWRQRIEDNIADDLIDVAENSYDRLLSWIGKGLETEDSVGCGFFILQSKSDKQSPAIVKMLDARKGKDPSFKLLSIYFAPDLNLEFKDETVGEDLANIKQVLLGAVSGATKHALSSGSKFKMYGRTQEIARLFEVMLANTQDQNVFTIKRQSRWLVIELK